MGWKQDFASLRKKMITKTGLSEASFDKRVTRRANERHLSPQAALYSIARDLDVSSIRDFKKLSDAEKSAVSAAPAISQIVVGSTNVSQSAASNNSRSRINGSQRSTINSDPATVKEAWYKKPLGQIAIGLIVGIGITLIVAGLKTITGWNLSS